MIALEPNQTWKHAMSSKTLFRAIERDVTLLPCPTVAVRVMEATASPGTSAADLERIIACDPAISAKLLKLANSAYYGVRQQVSRIQQAVVLLGFRTTRNIAVGASLSAWFKRTRQVGPTSADHLWQHSLRVAVCAEVLARCQSWNANPEDTFLAGLLHDLGILAEFEVCPQELEQVLELRNGAGMSHVEAERHVLGTDHGRLTHTLLGRWSFPDGLREAAARHHAHESMSFGLSPMSNTVALAEVLSAGQDAFSDGVVVDDPSLCSLLMVEPAGLALLREQASARWQSAQAWVGEGGE